jgi:hypothetical protein
VSEWNGRKKSFVYLKYGIATAVDPDGKYMEPVGEDINYCETPRMAVECGGGAGMCLVCGDSVDGIVKYLYIIQWGKGWTPCGEEM